MEDAMRAPCWTTISIKLIAVCAAMGTMLAASVAQGYCCVCQGAASFNQCAGDNLAFNCTNCSGTCAAFGATVRTCSDAVASCVGVADDCKTAFENVCVQTATGSGFCDAPTPTSTATNTGTATATGTVTNTATATATATN